jgi:hypothetical protein
LGIIGVVLLIFTIPVVLTILMCKGEELSSSGKKVWCERKKTMEKIILNTMIAVCVVLLIAIVVFSFWATIGYLTGYLHVPTSNDDQILTGAMLFTTLSVGMLIVAPALSIESTKSKVETALTYVMYFAGIVLLVIGIATVLLRFSGIIQDIAVIAGSIVLLPLTFTHRCMESCCASGRKRLVDRKLPYAVSVPSGACWGLPLSCFWSAR